MASSREQLTTPEDIKLSMTAVSVAMAFARALTIGYGGDCFSPRAKQIYQHLASAAYAALPKTGLSGFAFTFINALPSVQWQKNAFDAIAKMPLEEHLFLRRLLVEQTIREQIVQRGVEQVVFIGAGFDARGLLAAGQYPGVSFFELDRGLTRDAKANAIRRLPTFLNESMQISVSPDNTLKIGDNLHLIECDLSNQAISLEQVLTQHGFNKEKNTLVILEGVTMYLSEDNNQSLLRTLHALLNPGSAILLSYLTSLTADGAVSDAAYRESNETHEFALSSDEVIPFVAQSGFGVAGRYSTVDDLYRFGDAAADANTYYREHPHAKKEPYYLLTTDCLNTHNAMINVPVMAVRSDMPILHADTNTSCLCHIL